MSNNVDENSFRAFLGSFPDQAVTVLFDRHFMRLVRYSEVLTGNREASFDIVQEALIHIWQNHEELSKPHKESIQTYLVTIVKNRSKTYYTQSLRRQELLRMQNNDQHTEDSIEPALIKDETHAELRRVISTFPRREREYLLMKMDLEMTTSQIAREFGVTVKAIEKSLTNAYKRLRYHFGKDRL